MSGEERQLRRAERGYTHQLDAWAAERDGAAHMLDTAEHFTGTDAGGTGLLLAAGESVYLTVSGTALVEDRRGPGHYAGGSQGLSIPVGSLGGRTIRYRVGASRGHYVQGTPTPTAIDTGTTVVTDQRVVFRGDHQTRECPFARLLGYDHHEDGSTVFSLRNRKTPVVIHYGPGVADEFAFRLELALAHFQGTVDALVDRLRADLARLDAARPSDPVVAAQATAPDRPAAPPLPPAGWYPDPWGRARLRWWDGSAWTGDVPAD